MSKTYRARTQTDAVKEFQADASILARAGWAPTTQLWAQGGRSTAGVIWLIIAAPIILLGVLTVLLFPAAGLVLLVVGGIFVLIGNTGRSSGELSVTFERRSPAEPAVSATTTSPEARPGQLDSMRESGLISDEEYAAKRSDILKPL